MDIFKLPKKIWKEVRITIPRERIYGYWWQERINFGDLITPLILEKLSGRVAFNVIGARMSRKKALCGAGSLLQGIRYPNLTIWGSGFLSPRVRDRNAFPRQVLAYRGPLSARFAATLGWQRTSLLGDPGIVIPLFIPPEQDRHLIGLVLHYSHWHLLDKDFCNDSDFIVIDVQQSVEDVARLVSSCQIIVSSSLHGLVLAAAYGKPNVWLEPAVKRLDSFKFEDFYGAFDIERQPYNFRGNRMTKSELYKIAETAANSIAQQEVANRAELLMRSLEDWMGVSRSIDA